LGTNCLHVYVYLIVLGVAFFSKFRTGETGDITEDEEWPIDTGFYWIHGSPMGPGFLLSFRNAVVYTTKDIGGI